MGRREGGTIPSRVPTRLSSRKGELNVQRNEPEPRFFDLIPRAEGQSRTRSPSKFDSLHLDQNNGPLKCLQHYSPVAATVGELFPHLG